MNADQAVTAYGEFERELRHALETAQLMGQNRVNIRHETDEDKYQFLRDWIDDFEPVMEQQRHKLLVMFMKATRGEYEQEQADESK